MKSQPCILIVDDMPTNIKLLEAHLAREPYELLSAVDGEDALEKVKEHSPDLLLLDIMMPKMSGFEVCAKLKEDPDTCRIPVVMVTALDSPEDKVRGIEAGADDFLTKPVNRAELLARTRSLVQAKQNADRVAELQQAMTSLFELSTLSNRYADRTKLLDEFSKRCVQLARSEAAAIYLFFGGQPMMVGQYGIDQLDYAYDEVAKAILDSIVQTFNRTDQLLLGEKDEKIVGLPLIAYDGTMIGAMLAFGVGDEKDHPLDILKLVAQRLSSELVLLDWNSELEMRINERTRKQQETMSVLQAAYDELFQAQEETLLRLARAAEFRDEDTGAHLRRIANFSYMIAEELGLPSHFCERLRLASMMHDIGKIGVPDAVLLKPGRLTQSEWVIMKQHTVLGGRILAGSHSPLIQMSERVALGHHERFNGTGYPNQLQGDQIPLEARVVMLADVFDALTTQRVYKPAFSVERARKLIEQDVGSHFDPDVANAFFTIWDKILEIREQYGDDASELDPIEMEEAAAE